MPLRLTPIRQASKTFATKLKPIWLGKGMRSIGRGVSRIPLIPVAAAVKATGNVGSVVPFLQGISSVVATILQRAEMVKQNRKECKELASLATSVESAVRGVIEDVPEDELDEKMKKHIAELEKDMTKIVEIMTRLEGKPVWRRFLRKEKHSNALAEQRQRLEHGLSMFVVKEVIAGRHAQRSGHQASETPRTLYTEIGRLLSPPFFFSAMR